MNSSSPTRNPGRGYRIYVLLVLLAMNVCMVIDKGAIALVLEPIRKEFGVSDTSLGALSGLMFAVSFGAVGLPMGWLADRVNRKKLAAACLVVWSVMTMAGGFSGSFWQLALTRTGVGAGEAGGPPSAMSIISDYFSDARRSTAMAVFAAASPIGAFVSLAAGPLIVHAHGWRVMMMVAGLPGLVVALIILLTVREPVRGQADAVVAAQAAPTLRETLTLVRGQRSLVHLLIACLLCFVVIAANGSWIMTFIIRSHNVAMPKGAVQLASVVTLAGLAGTFAAGALADRFKKRDRRNPLFLIALSTAISIPAGIICLASESWFTTLMFLGLYMASQTFWFAPAYALCHSLVEVRMRGTVTGLLFLLTNFVGFGVGPLLIGVVSDLYAGHFGDQSLRYALITLLVFNAWAVTHFLLATRTVRADTARVKESEFLAQQRPIS